MDTGNDFTNRTFSIHTIIKNGKFFLDCDLRFCTQIYPNTSAENIFLSSKLNVNFTN